MSNDLNNYYNKIPLTPLLEKHGDELIALGLEEKAIYFVIKGLKKAVIEAMQSNINPNDLKIDTNGENWFLIDTKKSKILKEIPPLSFKRKAT